MSLKLSFTGDPLQAKALINLLQASGVCTDMKCHAPHYRRDGDVSQTLLLELTPAKHYASREVKPLKRDRQGFVYLLETPYEVEAPFVGIYKLGHARDVTDRKAQHSVKLPFAVKTVATIYSQDRYALERELLRHFAKVRIDGSEFVKLTAKDVANFCALG